MCMLLRGGDCGGGEGAHGAGVCALVSRVRVSLPYEYQGFPLHQGLRRLSTKYLLSNILSGKGFLFLND